MVVMKTYGVRAALEALNTVDFASSHLYQSGVFQSY